MSKAVETPKKEPAAASSAAQARAQKAKEVAARLDMPERLREKAVHALLDAANLAKMPDLVKLAISENRQNPLEAALGLAVGHGSVAAAKRLLEAGARVSVWDRREEGRENFAQGYPMDLLVEQLNRGNDAQMIELFIRHGCLDRSCALNCARYCIGGDGALSENLWDALLGLGLDPWSTVAGDAPVRFLLSQFDIDESFRERAFIEACARLPDEDEGARSLMENLQFHHGRFAISQKQFNALLGAIERQKDPDEGNFWACSTRKTPTAFLGGLLASCARHGAHRWSRALLDRVDGAAAREFVKGVRRNFHPEGFLIAAEKGFLFPKAALVDFVEQIEDAKIQTIGSIGSSKHRGWTDDNASRAGSLALAMIEKIDLTVATRGALGESAAAEGENESPAAARPKRATRSL